MRWAFSAGPLVLLQLLMGVSRLDAKDVTVLVDLAEVKGDNRVLGHVKRGTKLQVERESGSFLLITIPGTRTKGWISRDDAAEESSWEELGAARDAVRREYDSALQANDQKALLVAIEKTIELNRQDVQIGEGMVAAYPGEQYFVDSLKETRDRFISNAGTLIRWYELDQRWDKIIPLLKEISQVTAQRWGANDWRSVDARLALADGQAASRFTVAQVERNARASTLARDVHRHIDAKEFDAALPLAEEVMAIRRELQGEQHPLFATAAADLATIHWRRGDHAQARPLHEQALQIRKVTLGTKHPRYADSLRGLAEVQLPLGDVAPAESNFRAALDVYKATLGERTLECFYCLLGLSSVHVAKGDKAQAQDYLNQGQAVLDAVRADLEREKAADKAGQ